MWAYWQQVAQLEPQAQLSGTRVYKTGYHGPVDWMLIKHPNDYSIQRPADLRGPRTVGRAIDISYADARAGRTLEHKKTIIRVTKRVAAAVERKDPRMYGPGDVAKVREVIGTLDGRNTHLCSFLRERVSTRPYDPEDSHLWHNHVSITTEYVNDPQTYEDLLDIMFGDLTEEDDDDMPITDADAAKIADAVWAKKLTPGASTREIGRYDPDWDGAPAASWQMAPDAKLNRAWLAQLAEVERDKAEAAATAALSAVVADGFEWELTPAQMEQFAQVFVRELVGDVAT